MAVIGAARRGPPPVGAWVVILGGTGLVAGMGGPMLFLSDSNIAPIIGLLFTGPGGLVLGLIAGLVSRFLLAGLLGWPALWGTAALYGGAILIWCFVSPEPQYQGEVIEAQVVSCMTAEDYTPGRIAEWDRRIPTVTWAPPRAGWREQVPAMLAAEPGLVIAMRIERRARIERSRKPWSRGRLMAREWKSSEEVKNYFVRRTEAGCGAWTAGATARWYPMSEQSTEWPPVKLPNFLGLTVLMPVPEGYRALLSP